MARASEAVRREACDTRQNKASERESLRVAVDASWRNETPPGEGERACEPMSHCKSSRTMLSQLRRSDGWFLRRVAFELL